MLQALIGRIFGRRAPAPRRAPPIRAPAAKSKPAPEAAPIALPPPLPLKQLSPADQERVEAMVRALEERLETAPPAFDAFPAVCTQVLQLVSDPDVKLSDLARVIGQDQALSAAVLRVANSSFYKALAESQTLREAVARLGTSEVARLAGAVSVQALFRTKGRVIDPLLMTKLSELHLDSVSCALASSFLALRTRGARSDRAYLGGLLHDVGKSVVLRTASAMAQEKDAIVGLRDPLFLRACEAMHARAGSELARRWNLPAFVAEHCLHHHDGVAENSADAVELHVVRLVAAVSDLRKEAALHAAAAQAIHGSAAFLGLDAAALRSIETEAHRLRTRAATLVAA